MALKVEEKKELIKKFAREKGDTGSPEIQIALLSTKIAKLAEHLVEHKKMFTQEEDYFQWLQKKETSVILTKERRS